MFGAISDIKNTQNDLLVHCASQLARLLYDSELVLVNHQNCMKHNTSFLSNEKKNDRDSSCLSYFDHHLRKLNHSPPRKIACAQKVKTGIRI